MGLFRGPLVLLAPSLSIEDEFKGLPTIARIAGSPGIGALAFAAMRTAMKSMIKKEVPADQTEDLAREIGLNRIADNAQSLRKYVEFISSTIPAEALWCDRRRGPVVLATRMWWITNAERARSLPVPRRGWCESQTGHMLPTRRRRWSPS